MTALRNKRGTWINQFAQPPSSLFTARAAQVDYVIIKYGLASYERLAAQQGVPWLAERMGESGAGDQSGPSHAVQYATELAEQALQPGCIGAVINLEEADGGWHTDDGWKTLQLLKTFRDLAPGKPLFASLDTRGNRPNSPYQRACAELCDGVMPMVYPAAFQQPANLAFASAITELVRVRWAGKEIIPTFQTYGSAGITSQVAELWRLNDAGIIVGANSYTMGHATSTQWDLSLTFTPRDDVPDPPVPDLAAALQAIRAKWVETWQAIAERGTAAEAVALADFWRKLIGQP